MQEQLVTDKIFEKNDSNQTPSRRGNEHENCTFSNCYFSNADLSQSKFFDCQFIACNLSLVRLLKTVFQDAVFEDSKLPGSRFDECSPLGLSCQFLNCLLDDATFNGTKFIRTHFQNSLLHEVDFTDCKLTGPVFDDCDIMKTVSKKPFWSKHASAERSTIPLIPIEIVSKEQSSH